MAVHNQGKKVNAPPQDWTKPSQWAVASAPLAVQDEKTTAELAPFNPQSLWPRSIEETMRLADLLSKSGMVPDHLKGQPANVFYTILAGLELGVSPVVSCREIFFVNGRPSSSSSLKISLARESPKCVEFRLLPGSDNKKATYVAKRKGDTDYTTMTFTWEDAIAAGLAQKDMYKKFPARMLRARAGGMLADELFGDVVKGLGTRDDGDERDMGDAIRVSPLSPFGASMPMPEPKPKKGEVEEAETAEPAGEGAAQAAAPTEDYVDQLILRIRECDNQGTVDLLRMEANGKRKEWTPEQKEAVRGAFEAKESELSQGQG